jgi:hypothetical protein
MLPAIHSFCEQIPSYAARLQMQIGAIEQIPPNHSILRIVNAAGVQRGQDVL